MKHLGVALVGACVALLAWVPAGWGQTQAAKQDLSLLYVGHPGSEREKDFVQFLREHFRQVQSGDLAKFDAAQAAKADVVLLDYDGDGFQAPQVALPQGYSRPTVTIGVVGALICSQSGLNLKTGYL